MKTIKQLFFQLIRFSMVGITCFLVDYFLMIFLTEATRCNYFAASAISFIVSTIINYILSMRFVFKGKEDVSRTRELLLFVFLSLVGLGLNQMIMWVTVETLSIYYMIAKILSAVIVSAYNFISRKIFMEG